jgi:hypothetical protein
MHPFFVIITKGIKGVLLLAVLGFLPCLWAEMPVRYETERRHDDKMWALMRQMLVDFGYPEKAALLDAGWERTNTPEQWAAVEREQTAASNRAVMTAQLEKFDAARSPEVLAVLKSCQAVTSEGLEEVLIAACKASHNLVHITGGLALWEQRGGKPQLQGQYDKALHFIYGAYFEATMEMGDKAAVLKELLDKACGKPFDNDDMAASFAGAEWVRQAKTDDKWIDRWVSGQKTFAANLPALRYATGNQNQEYAAQIKQEILTSYTTDKL